MSKFEKQEIKGRERFISYCKAQAWCKFNKASKNPYSAWDVSFYSGETKMIGEIKNRYYKSDDFEDWYLQSNKLDSLNKIKEKYGKMGEKVNIIYINHFTDNETVMWDITNLINPEIEDVRLNPTYGDNERVNKEIIKLKKIDKIN